MEWARLIGFLYPFQPIAFPRPENICYIHPGDSTYCLSRMHPSQSLKTHCVCHVTAHYFASHTRHATQDITSPRTPSLRPVSLLVFHSPGPRRNRRRPSLHPSLLYSYIHVHTYITAQCLQTMLWAPCPAYSRTRWRSRDWLTLDGRLWASGFGV